MDNYSFLADKAAMTNLSSLSERQLRDEESRICEIASVAASAAQFLAAVTEDGLSLYDGLLLLSEGETLKAPLVHSDCLADNLSHLEKFAEELSANDKTAFSKLLSEYLGSFSLKMDEGLFFGSYSLPESFVYVKNSYSDEAFDVFSQDFSDPRVRYAQSFKDALKLVFDGAVTYCLLPIEERGARIMTVEELIFRGDFKINGVIPVFGFDGGADIKYALVSKNLTPSSYTSEDDRYLELRLPTDSNVSLSALLSSAETLGCSVYRVNTSTYHTEGNPQTYFSVVLKNTGSDFSQTLSYLTLFVPEYIPVGIYKNLE